MKRKGFTLIELLLVIGIIAILASIVIVAINPTKQLADARNAQRQSDVTTILNAVYQYAIDENNIPTTITTTVTDICQTGGDCTTPDPDYVDLSVLTTNGKYLVEMPKDPQTASTEANTTNYTIVKDANGRVTVAAPDAENDTISVTR